MVQEITTCLAPFLGHHLPEKQVRFKHQPKLYIYQIHTTVAEWRARKMNVIMTPKNMAVTLSNVKDANFKTTLTRVIITRAIYTYKLHLAPCSGYPVCV